MRPAEFQVKQMFEFRKILHWTGALMLIGSVEIAFCGTSADAAETPSEPTQVGRIEIDRATGGSCVLLFDSKLVSEAKLRAAAQLVYAEDAALKAEWIPRERLPLEPASEQWKALEQRVHTREAWLKKLDLPKATEPVRARWLEQGQFELKRLSVLNQFLRSKELVRDARPLQEFLIQARGAQLCVPVIRALHTKRNEGSFQGYWKAQVQECMMRGKLPVSKCEAIVRGAGITLEKFLDSRFLAEQEWWKCTETLRPDPVREFGTPETPAREQAFEKLLFAEECGGSSQDSEPSAEASDGPGQAIHN